MMLNLCDKCSNLKISEECAAQLHDTLKSSTDEDDPLSLPVADKVYSFFFPNIVDIVESTSQNITGFKCHLCLLLLRSLTTGKDDQNMKAHLQGPADLRLRLTADVITLTLEHLGGSGSPLRICIGSDETCRGSDVSLKASSTQVIATINTWLKDCKRHIQCRAEGYKSWLPTRVVDIGNGKDDLPKLVEASGKNGRYVTLSHRWNAHTSSSSTTIENFEPRKQGFDSSTLPLIFQDAIQVTRDLGIRYLWIDSLCIIQDSEEDWNREAKNMMSIYESAYINIAGAGMEGVNGRLFMDRESRLNRPCRISQTFSLLSKDLGSSSEPVYVFLDPTFSANNVLRGFLDQRGWIMQERILSPRTVYFGTSEVVWECSDKIASESIPWGFSDDCYLPNIKLKSVHGVPKQNTAAFYENNQLQLEPVWSTNSHPAQTSFNFGHIPVYDYWHKLIEAYSEKDLTRQMDKLPAISGLAQALHKTRLLGSNFGAFYQHGLWLEDLTRSLLWLPLSPFSDVLYNPSYSWASCSGPVAFPRLRFSSESSRYFNNFSRAQLGKQHKQYLFLSRYERIHKVWKPLRSSNDQGPVLRLTGPLIRVRLEFHEEWRDGKYVYSIRAPRPASRQSSIQASPATSTSLHTLLDSFRFKGGPFFYSDKGQFEGHFLSILGTSGSDTIGLILVLDDQLLPGYGLKGTTENMDTGFFLEHESARKVRNFHRIGIFWGNFADSIGGVPD